MVSICERFRGPPVGEGQVLSEGPLLTQFIFVHEFLLEPIKLRRFDRYMTVIADNRA